MIKKRMRNVEISTFTHISQEIYVLKSGFIKIISIFRNFIPNILA